MDSYDYVVVPGEIRIELVSPSDPILVDIFSEISNSDDLVYVEGRYYNYLDHYDIFVEGRKYWLSLRVIEILSDLIPDIINTRR